MTSGYPLSQAEKDEIVELSTNGLNTVGRLHPGSA